jgi:carboxylesterase
MTLTVIAGTEPYGADGGRVGVLLCHGFTGSPASMVPWARHLAEQGYTVRVPRLPGHGTSVKDMNTTRWTDWFDEVDRALSELRERCDRVVVAGLSMGGCLSLLLAERRAADVDALVLVNPAVHMKRLDLKLVPLLQWIVPSVPGIGNDIKKPGQDEIGYDKTPLKALASQLKMWKLVRGNLHQVTAPVLLMRSTDDHVVDETSAAIISQGVSSSVVTTLTLQNSFHVATLDLDAPLIFATADEFIAEHVGGPHD